MNLEQYKNRFDNQDDIEFLNIIQDVAKELYQGLKRKNGIDDYYNHIKDVVQTLIALNCANKTIIATAFLHDILEENKSLNNSQELKEMIKTRIIKTNPQEEWIKILDRIIFNVEILTFNNNYYNKNEQPYYKALYLHKIVNMSVYYYETLIVKIIDRLSNVKEFYNNGNIDYAQKYFTRGEILYGACYKNLEKYKIINETLVEMNESDIHIMNLYSYFNNLIYKINEIKKYIHQ